MRAPVVLLAAFMLLAGSLNTVVTKLQDTVVVGTDSRGDPIKFKHPVVQTLFMFAGEALCLIPFFVRQAISHHNNPEAAERKPAIFRRTMVAFTLPALCDAGATTLLNLGLYYTYASVFQMLRGTLVIFAGMLTIVLLRRRLHSHNWLGIVLITAGAALVGASSIIYEKEDARAGGASTPTAPNPLLGNLLVAIAQLLNATQFIVEEKFLRQIKPPVLLAVGSEGAVGLLLCALVIPIISRVPGPGGMPIDDVAAGVHQIATMPVLFWSTLVTVLSIAGFNFCGVSVTKRLSGAARAAIDACRTAIIWLFCLRMHWERFHVMQLVGFAVLITGTSVYNDILRACLPGPDPRLRRGHDRPSSATRREHSAAPTDEEEALLSDTESEASAGTSSTVIDQEQGTGAPSTEEGFGGPRAVPQGRPPLPRRSNPMAAKEVYASSPFTMARSVTILPGALSPHSLGSVPSDWNLLGASMGDGSVSVPDGLAELGGRADSGSPEEAHERRRTRRVTFERLDDE